MSDERKSEASTLLSQAKQQENSLAIQLKQIKAQSLEYSKLTSEQKKYADLQAQIELLEAESDKSKLSTQEQYVLANKEVLLIQYKKNAEISKEVAQYETSAKYLQEMREYTKKVIADAKAVQATFGMTSLDKSRYMQLSDLNVEYKVKFDGTTDKNEQTEITNKYLKAKEALEASWRQEDINRGDWVTGLSTGLKQYMETAQDVFSASSQLAQNSMNNMSSMMTDMLTTGKADFKEFTKSILTDITSIITKMMIAKAVQSSISAFRFSDGGYIGASFDVGGYTGAGGKFDVAGVVHRGEYVMPKTVVNTLGVDYLASIHWAGLAKKRGYANGGLVKAGAPSYMFNNSSTAQKSSSSNVINVSVVVNNQTSESTSNVKRQEKAIADAYQLAIRKGIAKETEQGGIIWKAMNKY